MEALSSKRGLSGLRALRLGPHEIARPLILAPMAGVSECPFRQIALAMGAGLAPTELVSARALQLGSARSEDYLRHDPDTEPLLAVQLFGGDPEAMAEAAERVVARGAGLVDINMGCPVRKVTKSGGGAALMTTPERAEAIVRAIRARVGDGVPVTAKLRAGWDERSINAAEVGRRLEQAGVAALALHPRTRAQGYEGAADWSLIAALKRSVAVPVIANGDIETVADADRVVTDTGCDAVMIGRAALGNPWIFSQLWAALEGRPVPEIPPPPERVGVVIQHFSALAEQVADELRAVRKFRQHVIWYTRGLRGAGALRNRVMTLESYDAVVDCLYRFFGETEVLDPVAPAQYDTRAALG